MANNTIKFDIKALADTQGLDEFAKQLRSLRGEAEPTDKMLGQAVKAVNDWAAASKKSADNTRLAVAAINALAGAMTAGGGEWAKATRDIQNYTRTLNQATSSAEALKSALASPAKTTAGASQQIGNLKKGLQDLAIGGEKYLGTLQQIIERESLLGRRTGRAGVVAANQAYEGALLTRGYGAAERLQQMPNTTAALRQRSSEIAESLPNLVRGSNEYIVAAREMRTVERELARDVSRSADETDALTAARKRLAEATRINRDSSRSGFAAFSSTIDQDIAAQRAVERNQERQRRQWLQALPPGAVPVSGDGRNQYPVGAGPVTTDLYRSIDSIASTGASARLQTLGRSYDEVAQQIRETAQAAGGSTRALQAERQAWEQLQGSVGPATRQYKEAGREMRRVDRRLGNSSRGERFLESAGAISAGAFFGGPEGLIGGLAGMAIGGPGAALGGASIGAQVGIVRQSVSDMSTYSAELEKLRTALRGVVKSQEEYEKSLQIINSATKDLNVPLESSLRGFTRLAASVVGAGGTVSDAEVVFKGITTALKATGKGAAEVDGSITALSQVFSKGKLSAEEINQIAERLPGTFNLISQAAGKSGPELYKALEQGQVSLNTVMRFSESLIAKYSDSADKIASSSEDAGARFKVAMDGFREEIGKTFIPLGATLQNSATDLLTYATTFVETFNKISKSIDDFVARRPALGTALENTRNAALLASSFMIPGGSVVAINNLSGGARQYAENQAGGRQASNTNGEYGPPAPGNTNEDIRKRLASLTTSLDKQQRGSAEFKRLQGEIKKLQDKLAQSYTTFANPSQDKGAEQDKKQRERAEREAERAYNQYVADTARQQQLELQLSKDRINLEQQIGDARIKQADRVFQYEQDLLRRRFDLQKRLEDIRLKTFIAQLPAEARNGVQPLLALRDSLNQIRQEGADLAQQRDLAKQQLESAKATAELTRRTELMIQQLDSVSQSVVTGGAIRGGATTDRVRDRDAEKTGYDIVHSGGRGAPIQAPVTLRITGTDFEGRGAGPKGKGYGNWITGEFELGGKKYELLVGHFDKVMVDRGMQVPAGGMLGTQGITGRTFGPHATTHVNPKGNATVADAWSALETLTRIWEKGGPGAMPSAPMQGNPVAALSRLIAAGESYGGNYGAFNTGGRDLRPVGSGINPRLTQMTVAQIMALQRQGKLHATGKFQIIGSTLRELMSGNMGPTGISPDDLYDPKTQEKLFEVLLGRRVNAARGNPDRLVSGLQNEWSALKKVPAQQLRQLAQQILSGGSSGSALTTLLANGREVQIPGAAASMRQTASAEAGVRGAETDLMYADKRIKDFEAKQAELRAAVTENAVEEITQPLREQNIALRENLDAFVARSEMQFKNMDPALIDFEINKTKQIDQQSKTLAGQLQLLEQFKGLFKPEDYDALVKKITTQSENLLRSALDYQKAMAMLQADPQYKLRQQIADLKKPIEDFNDPLKVALSLSEQFTSNLSSGFSNAANAVITGSGSIKTALADMFQSIGQMFLDMVARVLANAAAVNILKIFEKPLSAGTQGAFNSAVASTATGSAVSGIQRAGNNIASIVTGALGFASGGVSRGPSTGYPAMLHGTEAVVPLPNGRSIPVEMSGGGGTSVQVNVNMGTGESDVQSTEQEGRLLGQAISQAVQAELIKQKRPGGLLYR